MTKKDYELIALVFKEELEYHQRENDMGVGVIHQAVHKMAARLAQKNPSFQKSKFMEACGLG